MKNEFDSKFLANRIEMLCLQAGISKSKLFADCGLNRSIIDNLKKGSVPSVDKIAAIAEYFNVSTDYLIGRTEDSSVENESVSPVSVKQEATENKTDGMTSEFFRVFEALDWTDKLDTMQFARERMRKSV
ncbi:MAG: helix-turn-helix transcriptional regulator [Oscillospiraceae bacterium]|nr:helix-turn-helix transcriptional regulator [Oscillospiraceae bacterium]